MHHDKPQRAIQSKHKNFWGFIQHDGWGFNLKIQRASGMFNMETGLSEDELLTIPSRYFEEFREFLAQMNKKMAQYRRKFDPINRRRK